jgi:hypothetical protein
MVQLYFNFPIRLNYAVLIQAQEKFYILYEQNNQVE